MAIRTCVLLGDEPLDSKTTSRLELLGYEAVVCMIDLAFMPNGELDSGRVIQVCRDNDCLAIVDLFNIAECDMGEDFFASLEHSKIGVID